MKAALEYRLVLGTRVDATTYADAAGRILSWARAGLSRYVCVCNVHMVMEAHDAPDFQQIVNDADLVTPDGMPLVWGLRLMGLPESPRVDGATLTLHVCEAAARENIPIALYGGTEQSAGAFAEFLRRTYPSIHIAATIIPPFRELTEEEDAAYTRQLVESGARIIFVAIGCPKQERWMAAHAGKIPAAMIGVGAALDFHAGMIHRAPKWMQTAGLEWLFRLIMEPRRLWRRYARHNPRFVGLAAQQMLGMREFTGQPVKSRPAALRAAAKPLRILNVVGIRPNFMKIAPLMREYRKHAGQFQPLLVHTGQHYDDFMSQWFFDQLGLPKPDVFLGVGSGSHAEQTARIILNMEKLLLDARPDVVMVAGDANSTMAAAIASAKLHIPVAHIEAGLRSFDRTMPEEINRLVTDSLSEYCFTVSADADANLLREGVPPENVYLVGNVMIDTLLQLKDASLKSDIRAKLGLDARYAFVTLHRPGNVDVREALNEILSAIEVVQRDIPLVFPVHPRTESRMKEFGVWDQLHRWPNLKLTAPITYLDSLNLMSGATFVLTDSGGMQEETTVLGVPCLTVRKNTERPVTITEGTNTLVGTDRDRIVAESQKILAGHGKHGRVPKYWDGKSAERIITALLDNPPRR